MTRDQLIAEYRKEKAALQDRCDHLLDQLSAAKKEVTDQETKVLQLEAENAALRDKLEFHGIPFDKL